MEALADRQDPGVTEALLDRLTDQDEMVRLTGVTVRPTGGIRG